nr:disks large-associated protein 5-like [Leptinotarsa decemlineata]XP_023016143.1 disks large-associated protein 5-like [Leptinotarsa decemlineata]
MDLSEVFKTGFKNLHKQNLEKNYQQKTLKNRMEDFSYFRRQTRDTLLLQKRNLDLKNMSPYLTPEPVRSKKTSVKPKQDDIQPKPNKVETTSNKRLEMLKKWKEDKAKRIQEEKKNAKPIFKVCHVTNDRGLPKFEKEKSKPQEKFISKFAPKDHKFHAPKNIKPINIGVSGKSAINSKTMPSKKLTETTSKIQAQKNKSDEPKFNSISSQRLPTTKVNNGSRKNLRSEVSKCSVTRNTSKTAAKIADKTKKKVVDWNLPEGGSDNENILENGNKKRYQKTPQKRKNIATNNTDLEEKPKTSNKKNTLKRETEQKEAIFSDDEISLKTPIRKHCKSSVQFRSELENVRDCLEKKETHMKNKTENQELTNDVTCSETPSKINHTPRNERKSLQTDRSSPVNYISPFVTISRGKDSARKEFKVRQSTGGTFSNTSLGQEKFSDSTSPRRGAEYFTRTLEKEINRIESICSEWERYKDNDIPEEAINLIDVAVGQSKLLIAKKFNQFRNLIEECRSCQYKEKPITCTDLHGFWDMIYMQVGDLDKRFANLEVLKTNNWVEVIPEKKVTALKKARGRPKKVTSSSSLRNAIQAARNKKKQQENHLVENSEVFLVNSPVRKCPTPNIPSSLRRSLRVSVLNAQMEVNTKRVSSSPGLTMMKVTQAIKSGDGITPSRSILKSNINKSEKRITKSVLFKEDLGDNELLTEVNKENNASTLNSSISCPITPTRRSKRLNKNT